MWPILNKIALIFFVLITSCNTIDATVRQCCSDDQQLSLKTLKCIDKDPNAVPKLAIIERNIIHGRDCKDNQVQILLNPEKEKEHSFSINGGILTWDGTDYLHNDYCVDVIEGVALICEYGIDEDEVFSVIGNKFEFSLESYTIYSWYS